VCVCGGYKKEKERKKEKRERLKYIDL